MNEKKDSRMAKIFASAIKKVIIAEANSTSCIVFHQLKAPMELSKFRKER